MFGAGSIASMVQTMKNNRSLLKEKTQAFKHRIVKEGPFTHNKLSFKKATPRELELFRRELLAEKRREKRIRTLLWIIAILLLFTMLYFISN